MWIIIGNSLKQPHPLFEHISSQWRTQEPDDTRARNGHAAEVTPYERQTAREKECRKVQYLHYDVQFSLIFSQFARLTMVTISADTWQAHLRWWGTASSCWGMCHIVPHLGYVTVSSITFMIPLSILLPSCVVSVVTHCFHGVLLVCKPLHVVGFPLLLDLQN